MRNWRVPCSTETAAPAAFARTVTAAEIAARLRIRVRTFYKRRHHFQLVHRMPAPVAGPPFRWDRASIEAWFGRHHPAMPKAPPANDALPVPQPFGEDAWRAHLTAHYGPQGEGGARQ